MPNYYFLSTTYRNVERIIELFGSGDSDIVVPPSHLPVAGYFTPSGILVVKYEETSFTRLELCDRLEREEFEIEDEGCIHWNDCIVMIPIEKLKGNGVEIQIGEGWGWNEDLENEFRERPDGNHKWNPFSKMWEKVCEDCLELKHHNPNYDLFDYMTEGDLFGVNAEVSFCKCDRCPRCKRFQYIDDPHFHDDCERRE
jgi:hypothetical protein